MSSTKSIFISYAHEDKKWVDELSKFIVPWMKNKRISFWDDSKILPGSKWDEEIKNALDEANVVVILVSKDFLNSEYIATIELPKILERVKKNQVRLFWIAVGYSSFKATEIAHYQSANNPENPIENLRKPERDKVFAEIAHNIVNSSLVGSLASSFEVIDSTAEPIQAMIENRPERRAEYRVQANYTAQADQVSFSGSSQLITAEDLNKLPNEDKEYIADYEDSLRRNYQRWKQLREQLGVAGGSLDQEVNQQLTRVINLMCEDLNHILDFLKKMYKYELEDHYGRYRHLCHQFKSI
jgi:hypothetical protein